MSHVVSETLKHVVNKIFRNGKFKKKNTLVITSFEI